jgi:hypothetical protein
MPDAKIGNQFYLFPFDVSGIIIFVDIAFLILVAAPLAIYLIILAFSLQDIKGENAPADDNPNSAKEDGEITTISETLAEPTIVLPTSTAASRVDEFLSEMQHPEALPEPVVEKTPPNAPSETLVPTAMRIPAQITADETTENVAPRSETKPVELVPEASEPTAPPPEHSTAELIITPTAPDELAENVQDDENIEELLDADGPLQLPGKGSPKFTFDYRGRLWVEKKRKSFFRQLRRPQLPPDEPESR